MSTQLSYISLISRAPFGTGRLLSYYPLLPGCRMEPRVASVLFFSCSRSSSSIYFFAFSTRTRFCSSQTSSAPQASSPSEALCPGLQGCHRNKTFGSATLLKVAPKTITGYGPGEPHPFTRVMIQTSPSSLRVFALHLRSHEHSVSFGSCHFSCRIHHQKIPPAFWLLWSSRNHCS